MIAIVTSVSVAAACSSTTAAAGPGQLPARSAPASVGARVSPPDQRTASPAPWPERRLLRETAAERIAGQVIDPATESAYLLTLRTHAPVSGPWMVRRIDLRTGSQREGPSFAVGDIAMAAGY